VRREWADGGKMPFFEGEEFQRCLDRVWEAMGCTDRIDPNHGNRVLLDGAEKLGYKAKIVPQNGGGTKHDCGHCTLGCWSGEKKGPVNGWFPEAASKGVKFVEGMKVGRVLFEQKNGKKIAGGVEGVWTSRDGSKVEVVVRAKKVVVSCGTLWSPVVLMNSGVKVSTAQSASTAIVLTTIRIPKSARTCICTLRTLCRVSLRRTSSRGRV
jgi:choline dehydrogenase-like flavoprotein